MTFATTRYDTLVELTTGLIANKKSHFGNFSENELIAGALSALQYIYRMNREELANTRPPTFHFLLHRLPHSQLSV